MQFLCLGKLLFHSGGSNEHNCMVIIQMCVGGACFSFFKGFDLPRHKRQNCCAMSGKCISDLRANDNFRRCNGGRRRFYLANAYGLYASFWSKYYTLVYLVFVLYFDQCAALWLKLQLPFGLWAAWWCMCYTFIRATLWSLCRTFV